MLSCYETTMPNFKISHNICLTEVSAFLQSWLPNFIYVLDKTIPENFPFHTLSCLPLQLKGRVHELLSLQMGRIQAEKSNHKVGEVSI